MKNGYTADFGQLLPSASTTAAVNIVKSRLVNQLSTQNDCKADLDHKNGGKIDYQLGKMTNDYKDERMTNDYKDEKMIVKLTLEKFDLVPLHLLHASQRLQQQLHDDD